MRLRREPVATDRRFRTNRIPADHGPQERWQHSSRMMEPTEKAGVLAARALEECVLDIFVARGLIAAVHREAALRLRSDYQAAGLTVRVIGSYNPARSSFSPFGAWNERTEKEEAAYQRWRNAVRAIGIQFSDAVMTVACHDRMPGEQGMRDMKAGLAKLVKWYRMGE